MCQMEILHLIPPGACIPFDTLCVAQPDKSRKSVGASLRRLMLRDLIIRREEGCYALTSTGEAFLLSGQPITAGPRVASKLGQPRRACLTDKIWHALRIKRKASIADLQELAGTKTRTTHAYLRALEDAGYIIRNSRKRIVLVKDTGPLAPRLRQNETVILDRNTQETVAIIRQRLGRLDGRLRHLDHLGKTATEEKHHVA